MPPRQAASRNATHHQRRYHPVAGGILIRHAAALQKPDDTGRVHRRRQAHDGAAQPPAAFRAVRSRSDDAGDIGRRVLLLLAQRGALGGTLGKSL
jgi:hypothetical protein